jgi:glutamate/tyrosine decarboxylase-like PLP-dependent enzyme
LFTAALTALGWAVKRQVTRNDAIRVTLEQHTVAITQLTTSLTVVTTSNTRLIDDVEELDDASQQLQLATTVLRERLDANDRFRSELERHRPPDWAGGRS